MLYTKNFKGAQKDPKEFLAIGNFPPLARCVEKIDVPEVDTTDEGERESGEWSQTTD